MSIAYWPSKAALVLLFAGVTVLQTLSFPGKFRHLESVGEMTSGERWAATALVAAGLVPAGLLIGLALFGAVDDPGLPFLLTILGLGCLVLALLMLVMRSLLRQATTLRTDMDEVI